MPEPRVPPTNRPNIIFIMADDMGYGDVGCYNPESKIPTPNMDRLAREGVCFTDAHSASAVCTPSRYGVMTGRYCWRTRLKEGVIGGYEAPLIEESRLTLATMLQECGYHTACIGKWHIGLTFHDSDGKPTEDEQCIDFTQPVSGGPLDLGFDYAYYNAGCGTCAPPYGFIENRNFVDTSFSFFDPGKDGPLNIGSFGQWRGMMADSWDVKETDLLIAERACDYVRERSSEDPPFFLYLTPNAPHEPCVNELLPEFARGKSEAGARGDLVWLFDWIVGQVMDALTETDQADNTLIMVTSDNGALPGDFVLDDDGNRVDAGTGIREFLYHDYGHKSCGNYRGYKAHIWEGGHREPLIAHWPGRITPDSQSDALVCLTDIMATCAGICGYPLPNNAAEDSYDIRYAIPGVDLPADEPHAHIREAAVHHSSFGVFSIRQGRWKLVVDCSDSGGWPTPRGSHPQPGNPGQLYDVSCDPGEQDNLWNERQDVVTQLHAVLEDYREDGRSVPLR